MAHGRRDYTWGVLQDSILPGRYSANFNKFAYASVVPGITNTVYNYTVPPGYKLFLTAVYVSIDVAGLSFLTIKKGLENVLATRFSFNYVFSLGSYGSFPYDEGELLRVVVSNNDTIDGDCYVEVFGVLEELV